LLRTQKTICAIIVAPEIHCIGSSAIKLPQQPKHFCPALRAVWEAGPLVSGAASDDGKRTYAQPPAANVALSSVSRL
jgi:hypothetical protein